MNLSKLVVRKPTTIFIIFLIFVGLGLYSSRDIAIDLYPDITFPSIYVFCDNEGVGPFEIEKSITRVLESNLGSVSNLENITSTSTKGSSTIQLEFSYGTDLAEASNEIRDKIDFVKGFLPEEAETPRIFKINSSMIPILYLAVKGNRSAEELKVVAEDVIAPRLEQIDGVATAGVDGGRNRIIRVEISQNRLKAHNLTITEISAKLRGQNIELSAGNITEGNKEYLIQTAGTYETIEQIKNTVISQVGNTTLRLSDIAEVFDGFDDETSQVLLNGEPAITITIQKQSGTNSVQTADEILKRMKTLEKELPRGISIDVVWDSTKIIRNSIKSVTTTAMLGGFLAIVILSIFLRSLKSVIIISCSIPISIIITTLFMYFFGLTFNMMTLAGLALGIGMLVDNSIVILENIYRYREKGAKVTAASILGSQEMTTAIIASTLTTICVFLPLALFKNQLELVGELVSALAFTIVFSLTSSIVVAILLVPVLTSHYLPLSSRLESAKRNPIDLLLEKFFTGLDNAYKKALGVVLRHRVITIIVIFLIFIGSIVVSMGVGMNFLPSEEADAVQIELELPIGTKIELTKNVVNQFRKIIEDEVEGYKEIVTWAGMRGFMGFMGASQAYKGRILITLPEFSDRIESSSQINEKLRKHFNDFPSVTFKFSSGGGPGGGSSSPIDLMVKSNDLDKAREYATRIKEILKDHVEEATEPDIDLNDGLPQIEIYIDRDKAYSYGLNISAIANEIRANINGAVASRYKEGGREYDILLILEEKDRDALPDLEKIFVFNQQRQRIPLSNFAYIKKTVGPVDIKRENQMRVVHVMAGLKRGTALNEVVAKIDRLIDKELYKDDDIILAWSGDAAELQEILMKFVIILAISIFLVFGVMASQFESFLDPFIIFFCIPLMIIGVALIYLLTGEQFSMFTAVGIVVLSGIVVNNGIVLVDYTNLLVKRGHGIIEACIEAGGNRLRPILMTTLTSILGMSPMAFIKGEGSELSQPIAKTVVGGLAVSTIFTLFLIPVIYSIFNQLAAKSKAKAYIRKQKRLEIRKEKIAARKAEQARIEQPTKDVKDNGEG